MFSRNIPNIFGQADIIFVRRLNKQIDVSCYSDAPAIAIKAFSQNWYIIFPDFSIEGQALSKITLKRVKTVAFALNWATQYWYPQFLQMTTEELPILNN